MGIKERKERDKEEMRSKILQSAHDLFLDRSFEEISIRNIADAIEYSPATIYLYFKDKNEIFYSLQTEAFKVFNEYVSTPTTNNSGFQKLTNLVDKYLCFAFTHPKYYNIMFLMESPGGPTDSPQRLLEGNKAHTYLEIIIEHCKSDGHFAKLNTTTISFMIWSYVHGVCSLTLRNRMRIYPVEHRESIRIDSVKQFINLLKST